MLSAGGGRCPCNIPKMRQKTRRHILSSLMMIDLREVLTGYVAAKNTSIARLQSLSRLKDI
jgi:hypothetical protein